MTVAVPAEWIRGTTIRYPRAGLAQLIWEHARQRPDAIAVRQWDRELSYGGLIAAAADVASRLAAAGVAAESRVVVCAARQPGMVAAVAGVLAAGAAYVPIDPAHPAGRRDVIIADAGVRAAVVDDTGRAALADTGLTLIDVTVGLTGAAADDALVQHVPEPAPTGLDAAAYVLYTSGSTGVPKGVVVSHRSAVAFCTSAAVTCGVDARTRGIAFASLTFDVSVLDLFTVLIAGGTVCLVGDDDRADPDRLQKFLIGHRVTWGYLPPALLPLLDPVPLTELTELIVGGEATSPEQVERWSAGRAFRNWYGPTEATVSVTGARLDGAWSTPLPIGSPLPNHRCYVLDGNLDQVPVGVVGELYVSGVGLARGYLDAPGLTAARFRPDPYAAEPGQRMYATGDRVRWQPDGRLAFLGRLDGQVKVNGHRIEVGEIEAVLSAHPQVAQSAVEVRRDPATGARLIAYVTGPDAPDEAELREFAGRRLPGYMVPSQFVRLDALPLTASSKVDFAALARQVSSSGGDTGPARAAGRDPDEVDNPVHRAVASAWRQALAVPRAGWDDDFVASGGTSLAAMRLSGLLSRQLGRRVSVADVFRAGTPRQLAISVGAAAGVTAEATAEPALEPATESATANQPRLSAAQRRLWFVDRLAGGTPAYNIAIAQRLRGPLDVAALSRAIAAAVRRHAALRWRIPDRDGVPHVVVMPAEPIRLIAEPVPPSRLPGVLDEEAARRFDLGAGPLWRCRLLETGPDEHILALTVHHIVFDGWSLDVLYRDISRAYRDPVALDGDATDFADYVAWSERISATAAPADRQWWQEQLSGVPTVLELPGDRRRPPVSGFRGASADRPVPSAIATRLDRMTRQLRVTGYAALLATFGVLVRRLSGATDMVIGAPAAHRRHPGFDGTVGFMVDTLPIRIRIDDDAPFASHAHACQQTVIEAIEHRSVPFERIVEDLRAPRDLSRNPVVQVLFNMYSLAGVDLDLPGIAAEEVTGGVPGSLFDVTLYAIERAGGLNLQAVYNPDLFGPERVEAMLDSYLALLEAFVTDPSMPVGSAPARPRRSTLPDLDRPLAPAIAVEPIAATVATQVRQRLDDPAVDGPGGTLSYRQMWDLASSVAAGIRADGASEIGILSARDSALPAVLLGALRSGVRWLLIDPAQPAARLAALVRQAGVTLLVACPGTAIPAELSGMPALDVATVGAAPGQTLPEPPTGFGRYALTTSGSTGTPVIVECDERPLARFLDWYARRFAVSAEDRTALLGGLGHDPLLRDALVPLVAGGLVCVPEPEWLRDPLRLAGFLAERGVTIVHLTPALGRALALAGAVLPAARLVVCGGDRLAPTDVAALRRLAPNATLVNGYGTTETPQLQALHELAGDGSEADLAAVPVGSGVNGAELHIRTPGRTPAAVGELGEVLVRGRNLATGYATAAGDDGPPRSGFVQTNEHMGTAGDGRPPGDPDDRTFATGDLGRYDSRGLVVVAGRLDDQVKIRGFRVELGEIESALASHPDVTAAAAAVRGSGDGQVIYAYAVPRRAAVATADLRAHLAAALPEYARPKEVILVTEIPISRNGKVDRSALPAPAGPSVAGHTEAATPVERQIAAIWREVLGLPRVSVTANFFDIGGHSLAVVAVQARLRQVLARHVELVDLFRFPSIRSLAAHLSGDQRAPGLDRAERRLAVQRRRVPAKRPATGPTRLTRSAPHEHPDA